jgi:TolA-binding protein
MDLNKVRRFSKAPIAPQSTVVAKPAPATTQPPVRQFSQDQSNLAGIEQFMKQFSEKLDIINRNVASTANRVTALEKTQKRFSEEWGNATAAPDKGGQDTGVTTPEATPATGSLTVLESTDPAPINPPATLEYPSVPDPQVVATYSAPQPVQNVATGTARLGHMDPKLFS